MNKYILNFILIILVVFMTGCDRYIDAPTRSSERLGTLVQIDDNMSQFANSFYVYLPPEYDQDRILGYPVLYLLNGFGGDENYFISYFSILDAIDLLYSRGEIKDMILVLPSGTNPLGGTFYTNSSHPAVGNAEQHILNIVSRVESSYNVSANSEFRAIGGFSMGGYGALSIVKNNPNEFGYVSAHAAPAAFWGDKSIDGMDISYAGIESLLPTILQETGYQAVLDTLPEGDATSWANMIYPNSDRVTTSMMFAMAAAFSPFDQNNPYLPTLLAEMVVNEYTDTLDVTHYERESIYLNLPIGHDGKLDTVTWNRWLEKDLTECLLDPEKGLGGLEFSKIYLHVGTDEPTHGLGLNAAHIVFSKALESLGIIPDQNIYYDGIVDAFSVPVYADHTSFTFERLKEVLKWHSDQFPN